MTTRLSTTMALTVVVLATARSSAELAPWRLYPAVRSGVTTQEFSPTGWWFDAGLATERSIGPPWLYVSMEAALAATRDVESTAMQYFPRQEDQTSHTRRFTLGIPLRVGLGIGTEVFGVEVGGVAGATWTSLRCDVCPSESKLRPVLGGYAGPVLRIGSNPQIRLAAQFQMISPILPKCTNWDGTDADYTMHPVWFYASPPNPSIVGQLGFQW